MSCIVKIANLRLCRPWSRFGNVPCTSQEFFKRVLQRNSFATVTQDEDDDRKQSERKTTSGNIVPPSRLTKDPITIGSSRLTAKWKWVTRGEYKVAAFNTENNPATAVESKQGQYWHRHKCPNCQTVYDHTHPYSSLYHPQHVKDCPKCGEFAPPDLKVNQLS